eukprot:TRINITY_DN2386_c0_g1_i1.p1 TRINITY_DN2386_c0_g1~~TRINITY_DN2386_c0_g1_i1.p1  ORF type:complete len:166 (-),score=64.92 TRINITY_DN2386_c0_g1_i1:156-653(-)
MAEGWDAQLETYLISEGYCCAAGLAQMEDGAFYAAAPTAGEAGWGLIYKEDHEQDILQEDGETTKKFTISEATALKELMTKGKAPTTGLWFAGEKYRVPQVDLEFELGDNKVKWAFGAAPKKGVHIVATNSQIVAGFYSEEKGQSSGNCKKSVLAFAEWLLAEGY